MPDLSECLMIIAFSTVALGRYWWFSILLLTLSSIMFYKKRSKYHDYYFPLGLLAFSWLLYTLPYWIRFGKFQYYEGWWAYPKIDDLDIVFCVLGLAAGIAAIITWIAFLLKKR